MLVLCWSLWVFLCLTVYFSYIATSTSWENLLVHNLSCAVSKTLWPKKIIHVSCNFFYLLVVGQSNFFFIGSKKYSVLNYKFSPEQNRQLIFRGLRDATQSPARPSIFSSLKIGGGRWVNLGFGKIETKDSNIFAAHPAPMWEIQTTDRRGEGGPAIFSELKKADFPGLCVASLRPPSRIFA